MNTNMMDDLEEVLYTKEEIAEGVKRVAAQIRNDYAGRQLVCVGILKGGFIFMSDLVREMDMPAELDFMVVSSYGNNTTSTGALIIRKELTCDIRNRDVLIIEDIVDSGRTLSYLKEYLSGRGAASIRICALLDKPSGRKVELEADYSVFECENKFVVGYGLDFAEKYRNLPLIGVLKPEIYKKA